MATVFMKSGFSGPQLSLIGDSSAPRVSTDVYAGPSANLDLLRSFAVALVLAVHVGGVLAGINLAAPGRFGVLLFFVHTALVLLRSLDRLHADGKGSVTARFYLARAFRIWPLYLAVIAFVLAFRIRLIDSDPVWQGWRWFAVNVLMLQNLTYDWPVTAPMWSLPYEMQMYLVLPVIWLISKRREATTNLILIAAGAAALATVVAVIWPQSRGLYSAPTFFVPCFMGGAYAFVRTKKRGNIQAAAFPLFLLVAGALFFLFPTSPFQWLVCTLIGFALPEFKDITSRKINAITSTVAKYSYGIYLWHMPLLWLCLEAHKKNSIPMPVAVVLFAVALAAFSVAGYHLIEAPMIRLGRSVTTRSRSSIHLRLLALQP